MSGDTPWREIRHKGVNAPQDSPLPSDTPPTARDPRKCSYVREDGSLCEAWKAKGYPYCAGHAGLVGGDTRRHTPEGVGDGQAEEEKRLSEPLRALRGILRDRNAPQAAVVQAARALLDVDKHGPVAKPRSVREVLAMDSDGLERLIATLDHAHALPEGEMPGQGQA